MIDLPVYVVTDVEFDGPLPGTHSMLSFASVAVLPGGEEAGAFEAVLAPLPGAVVDPQTMAFWRTQPDAYVEATRDPEPPAAVMRRYVAWVRGLGRQPVFVAHPVALDAPWIDFYLERFTGERVLEGPWRPDRLFRAAPLCLMSFAAGRLGRPIWECDVGHYPAAWLGDHPHSHKAIDDARGYARLLARLLAEPANSEPAAPDQR